MALVSTQLAYMTARFGAGRFGAFRFGFTPKETEGTTPGSAGPFYVWRELPKVTTVWVES